MKKEFQTKFQLFILISLVLTSCHLKQENQKRTEYDGIVPEPIGATPSKAQVTWQELERYAFIHFGLNTFNNQEWGYGNTPATTFAPDSLYVNQWVETLKRAGMKAIILTAKHHDGFCLWPTQSTEYSVKNAPWKNGKGDLVKELSEACQKHGLKFGIYLSPWDRNNRYYGMDQYVKDVFHKQIEELTHAYGELFEYWFDGANGGTGWYGGANERRTISPKTYYQYEKATQLLKENNPNIMIFGGTVPTIRWVGNEQGFAGEENYSAYDYKKESNHHQAENGMSDAKEWLPAEVDVSIRSGWFFHKNEQVKSLKKLIDIYYQSVGRNANLLLNCPIDLSGRIPSLDSLRLMEWNEYLKESFKNDLAKQAKFSSPDSRKGQLFSFKHLNDEDKATYWATKDQLNKASLSIIFNQAQELNTISLSEYIPLGQRVQAFSIFYKHAGQWIKIPSHEQLQTIGYKRLIRLDQTIQTKELKIIFSKIKGAVCLSNISIFKTPKIPKEPNFEKKAL